jgi:chromosome segregation ATPase
MSDQRGDLVLEMLRAIRGDLAEVKVDLAELKQRVGLLEGQYASLSARVDRIAGDVVQIKRRLDLVDA